jgi:polysaccharide pyruvyl transferase WcaK-like protein
MRIVIETAINIEAEYQNMGDVAMLQVAVNRLFEMWPSASIEVITGSSEKLAYYCPGAKMLSRAGCDLWLDDKVLLGTLHRFLPEWLSAKMSRLKKAFRAHCPSFISFLLRTKLQIKGRGSECKVLMEFINSIQNADLVMLCGAGGFADSCKKFTLSRLDVLEEAIQRGRVVVIFGQGIGPLSDPELISRSKKILPAISLITLRGGRGGFDICKSLGVPESRILTTGDEAVELAYDARPENLGNALGLNFRVATSSQIEMGYIERVKPVVQQFAKHHSVPLVSVPIAFHQWANDNTMYQQLVDGFEGQSDDGLQLDTPLKVITQAGRCRVVVTGAYHAAVFALSQGIPVVCLSNSSYYDAKFLGLEDQFGQGCETVSLGDSDVSRKLTAAIEKAWQSAETVRPLLLQASLSQINSSQSSYDRVRVLIEAKCFRSSARNVAVRI